MTIQIIAVAYERLIPLRILIDSFLVQTDPRWNLHVIYDGPVPQDIQNMVNGYSDERVNFYCTQKRNGKYGHPNRREMLNKLSGSHDDYVLLTNDDNYYVPTYVEKMLNECSKDVGIVSCNTVHSHFNYDVHNSHIAEGGIDMGAFIVRYEIAKAVGFNYTHFSADGKYAEECGMLCGANRLTVVHIPKPLFIHN